MLNIIQIFYWLALATWFGGALFIAIAAPIIMSVVREHRPVLTDVLSVNLEGQHSTLLGGSIIGRIKTILVRVEIACAAVLLLAIIGQWVILRPSGAYLLSPIVRSGLYLGAVLLLIYDWRIVWPRMWKYRQEYLDHADEPEIANPALDQLNRYQAESANILALTVCLLLGVILFSAGIQPTLVVPMQ